MYNDWFTIGPITIHGYGACMGIGLICALILAIKRGKKKNLNEDIFYGILFWAAIIGWIGAKIMYIIVEWDSFIKDPISFISSSGFVVYGGITAGFITAILYCKIKKVDVLTYIDMAIPSVALAQGIGRIGCFLAGCCYGRVTDSWIGIAFKHSDFAPNGVKLIPTQLISAGADFINCIVLILIAGKTKKKGLVFSLYLVFYSIGRFLIEFLRNDDRGRVGVLSTSQFYGILFGAVGITLVILTNILNKKKEA